VAFWHEWSRPKCDYNARVRKAQLLSAGYMGFAHAAMTPKKPWYHRLAFCANSAGTLDQLPHWLNSAAGWRRKRHHTWIVFACALIMALGTA